MVFDEFQGSRWPSLGVELELQLVDAQSLALTSAIGEVLPAIPERFRDAIQPEFYDCCVEIKTGICHDVAEVRQDLLAKLATMKRVAIDHGVLLGWGGTHPFSHWRDQPIVSTPRYRELAEQYRETLCRQLTFGLHVHVGVADGSAAVHVCNRITEYLPVLLALSANSPFWCGRPTGLHSQRVEVMEASPTGGIPPLLDSWDSYARLVSDLITAGLIQTHKDLWWDARPNPTFGTVEIRMCDMPIDLDSVLHLTALIQCLVVDLAESDLDDSKDECALMIIRQNRWRAARYGLAATLIDLETRHGSAARDVLKALIVRLEGVAKRLGCTQTLSQLMAAVDSPNGAERQIETFVRTGDLSDVVRLQVHQPVLRPGNTANSTYLRHGSVDRGRSRLPIQVPSASLHPMSETV